MQSSYRLLGCILLTIISASACRTLAEIPRGLTECNEQFYSSPTELKSSAITLHASKGDQCQVRAEARVAMKSYTPFELQPKSNWKLTYYIRKAQPITFAMKFGNSIISDFTGVGDVYLEVTQGSHKIYSEKVEKFSAHRKHFNSLAVTLTDGNFEVSGGRSKLEHIANIPVSGIFCVDSVSLSAEGTAEVRDFYLEQCNKLPRATPTKWDRQNLFSHLKHSKDSTEGLWYFYGRDTEPKYAHPGGYYTLAIVRNDSAESLDYDILYINGAEVNASHWKPFMLKGGLKRTTFNDAFDLIWYDADFIEMNRDIYVNFLDYETLDISFPIYKAKFHYARQKPEELLKLP